MNFSKIERPTVVLTFIIKMLTILIWKLRKRYSTTNFTKFWIINDLKEAMCRLIRKASVLLKTKHESLMTLTYLTHHLLILSKVMDSRTMGTHITTTRHKMEQIKLSTRTQEKDNSNRPLKAFYSLQLALAFNILILLWCLYLSKLTPPIFHRSMGIQLKSQKNTGTLCLPRSLQLTLKCKRYNKILIHRL